MNEQRDEWLPGPGFLGVLEGTLWAILGLVLGPGTLYLVAWPWRMLCLASPLPSLLQDSQGLWICVCRKRQAEGAKSFIQIISNYPIC